MRKRKKAKEGFKLKTPPAFYYMVFCIQNWKEWDREIDTAVQRFRKKYPVYPHILLASTITHRKFDMLAFTLHPEKIKREEPSGEKTLEPILEPGSGLAGFVGEEYELEFYILEDAPTGFYVLVYDSDPDDGEPLPDFGFQDFSSREWEKRIAI